LIDMLWESLILALTGLFATGVSLYLHRDTERLKFLGLFFASGLFTIAELSAALRTIITGDTANFIANLLIEWCHIFCIAFVLSSLLLFIRESKPEFSRFPLIYGTLPLVIIISYLLVYDTIVLKFWLLNIYQGGAAIVALMMYGIYSYQDPVYGTLAVGSALFVVSFLLYTIIPGYALIWQTCLALGVIITFCGYLVVEKHYANAFTD